MVLHATPAWIAFSWLVLFSYDVLGDFRATGVWHESEWIRALEYIPVYLLLAWSPLTHHLRHHLRRLSRNAAPAPTSAK